MTDNVLGATFGLESEYFGNFKKSSQDVLLTSRSNINNDGVTTYQKIPNYHKFNLKGFQPTVQSRGGYKQLERLSNVTKEV